MLDGDRTRTQPLLHVLQAEPSSSGSIVLVEGLTQCVSHFRPDRHASLVDAVLSLHWQQRPKLSLAMPRAVVRFVQELVSAAPAFLPQCVTALIRTMLPPEADEPERDGGAAAGEPADQVSPLVHAALDGILRGCPVATDYVFDALRAAFPHKRREARAHAAFTRHCLAVLRYSPALTKRVVGLLVARMVELDVEIALQQVSGHGLGRVWSGREPVGGYGRRAHLPLVRGRRVGMGPAAPRHQTVPGLRAARVQLIAQMLWKSIPNPPSGIQRHLDEAEEEEEEDEPIFELDSGDSLSEEIGKMRKNADKLDGVSALPPPARLASQTRRAGLRAPDADLLQPPALALKLAPETRP